MNNKTVLENEINDLIKEYDLRVAEIPDDNSSSDYIYPSEFDGIEHGVIETLKDVNNWDADEYNKQTIHIGLEILEKIKQYRGIKTKEQKIREAYAELDDGYDSSWTLNEIYNSCKYVINDDIEKAFIGDESLIEEAQTFLDILKMF